MAEKSQSMACSVPGAMGRICWRAPRAVAQVRTVRQLRWALPRVVFAVPRGAIISVKAWLIAGIVFGTMRESAARIGS